MVKLTKYTSNGGRAVKIGPDALAQVLCQLPRSSDPRLMVGLDTADDAGVYRLDDCTVLIQTLDFFTPIVDDPYMFGQIAAANSLSDIYAMGGKPLTAMNIVAFPLEKLSGEILLEILRGGQSKVEEAGAVLVGGHSIKDDEPKYGLSVTGIAHPDKIATNAGARPGDLIILTKPIGTGVLATAACAEMFEHGVQAAIASMAALNRTAAELMSKVGVTACTDVTGFGLLGHLREMASASKIDVEIDSRAVPMLPQAVEAAAMGLVPEGAYTNRHYLQSVYFHPSVPEPICDLCFDPQTSGGLLISAPPATAEVLLKDLHAAGIVQAALIGRVTSGGRGDIEVI